MNRNYLREYLKLEGFDSYAGFKNHVELIPDPWDRVSKFLALYVFINVVEKIEEATK